MASSSSSGLTFKLHPLVIVNISDHHTRVKSQSQPSNSSNPPPPPPRVFGCVIGVQRGRTVEIFNSFELLYDPSTHSLDRSFLEKKQELYKKVFPNFYILGWYSTGADAQESDMHIHKALMDINESPVYVLLNPSINHAQKDLPVTIYESGLLSSLKSKVQLPLSLSSLFPALSVSMLPFHCVMKVGEEDHQTAETLSQNSELQSPKSKHQYKFAISTIFKSSSAPMKLGSSRETAASLFGAEAMLPFIFSVCDESQTVLYNLDDGVKGCSQLELHVIDGIPQLIFVRSSYTIETVEAERISVDHVAHLKPSDGGSAATQLAAHLTGIHSAIKMLNSRIRVLHHYLNAMQKGEIPYENSLLRQVSSLLRRLPAIESEKFRDDFLMEYNDTLLISYLAMFTDCSSTMNDLVDKINVAYDRHSRRGGRTAFI